METGEIANAQAKQLAGGWASEMAARENANLEAKKLSLAKRIVACEEARREELLPCWAAAAAALGGTGLACVLVMQMFVLTAGISILDSALPLWTADTCSGLLGAMGESGRKAYMTVNQLDFLFAAMYSSLMCLLLARRGWSVASGLPLLTGAFDLGEGVCIRALLHAFPDVGSEPDALRWGPLLTRAKWVAFVASVVALAAAYAARPPPAPKRKAE